MSIEKEIDFSMLQLGYQSFQTDVKLGNIQLITPFPKSQLAYHSFQADVKVSSIQYPGEEMYLKASYNPIMFVFAGKAWLFDGSRFDEFGSPFAVIYPFIATYDGKIIAGGGMFEDSTVAGDIYGFGIDTYFMTADRDYLAVVIPSDVVYVIDADDNIVLTSRKICVVPLLKEWKLVSRKPFVAIVQRLL